MRIDEHEVIDIWLAGNTGLRNPMRIQEGFIAFSQSPYVGNLHGRENEIGFMDFLDKTGIINNESEMAIDVRALRLHLWAGKKAERL